MTTRNRSIGAISLIALYFSAITVVMAGRSVYYSYDDAQNSDEELYLSMVSASMFYHTPKSETGVYTLENPLLINFKVPFKELWATSAVPEHLFRIEYSDYGLYACNLRIRYRKNDLIFPFHYFW